MTQINDFVFIYFWLHFFIYEIKACEFLEEQIRFEGTLKFKHESLVSYNALVELTYSYLLYNKRLV